MPRCKNGTRRNKKSGNCEPKRASTRCPKSTRRNKKTYICETVRITDTKLNEIINNLKPNMTDEKIMQLERMRPTLKKIKYSKSYKSCFTGKATRDIIDMIETKIACWSKYGDDI